MKDSHNDMTIYPFDKLALDYNYKKGAAKGLV
jgi:hypothetical protein